MWKTKLEMTPLGAPGDRNSHSVMAHRRAVGGRKLAGGAVAVLVFTFLLAGSVYVSNCVTEMRAEIARLEEQRGFLEASSARLLTEWNRETAPALVIARAEQELGLILPAEPGLVLVQLREDEKRTSAWRRLLANMGGGDPLQAAELDPTWIMGSMVSLTPHTAQAQGDD